MSDRLVCRCGVIGALRVLIILFAVCCLGLQIGLFVVAGGVAAAHPYADALHWLYVIDGALMVACFEIALIPLWRLLTLARRRDVFPARRCIGRTVFLRAPEPRPYWWSC